MIGYQIVMRRTWGAYLIVFLSLTGCRGQEQSRKSDAGVGRDAAPIPTWTQNIGDLVHSRCNSCHSEGGSVPLLLETYEQVASISELIRFVVSTRRMPPWPAESGSACQTYQGDRWLSEAEIALVQMWVDNDAPRRDGPLPVFNPSPPQPFVASARLEASSPYTVMPGPDEYRCFVVDPNLVSDRYLTAFNVVLDQSEVVHHIQLYALDKEGVESAELLDSQDEEPGFSCFNASSYGTYLEVWAKGDRVRRYPRGVGQRLSAGTVLLYQIHYHPLEMPLADHTAVELELVDDVEYPAKILSFANYPLTLPPGQKRVEISAQHPLYLDDAKVIGARLHMHNLGVDGRITIEHQGDSTCALLIPRWDFEWQMFYYFDNPIPKGDTVQLTCAYDTRSRVTTTQWGNSTEDEMCLGYLLITTPKKLE